MWKLVVLNKKMYLVNDELKQNISMGGIKSKINVANAKYELERRLKDPNVQTHDYNSEYSRLLFNYILKQVRGYVNSIFVKNKKVIIEDAYNAVVTSFLSCCRNYKPESGNSFHCFAIYCCVKNAKSYVYNKYKIKSKKPVFLNKRITNSLLDKTKWHSLSEIKPDVNYLVKELPINSLGKKQKETLMARYLDLMTYEAIAKKEKVSREAIRSRINKSIKKIRLIIQKRSKTEVFDHGE